MIDIHTHLLPGVDDGSPSIDVSLTALRRFRDDGVTTVVCTPHLAASAADRVPHEDYQRRFVELVSSAPGDGPALKLGYEILLDVPGVDLTGPHLALGGSTAVLVEFPRGGVPPAAGDELHRLRMSGVVPVVAHPERYRGCTLDHLRQWRRAGAVIQTDGMMLLGSGPPAQLARAMLAEGLVDCIASDNHGDVRSILPARQWLLEIGAAEQAELLTHVNAERLLESKPVYPVAPIPRVERGMLSRLKELLLGRR